MAQSRDPILHEPAIGALIAKGTATQYSGYTYENLTKALALFEEALARAPDYPLAMVAVAAVVRVSTAPCAEISAHATC